MITYLKVLARTLFQVFAKTIHRTHRTLLKVLARTLFRAQFKVFAKTFHRTHRTLCNVLLLTLSKVPARTLGSLPTLLTGTSIGQQSVQRIQWITRAGDVAVTPELSGGKL